MPAICEDIFYTMVTTKNEWTILIFTITYTLLFGIYFGSIGNFEFLWYVGILSALILLVIFLHSRFRFSTVVLWAISIWGLLHMIGGSDIAEKRTYARMIYPLFPAEVAGTDILRYDQFMHFYVYVVVTLMIFYILSPYMKKEIPRWLFGATLVITGIGVGAINEMIEFVPVLVFGNTGVGDYFNTLWDIVFNTAGALFSLVYLVMSKKI